MSNIATGVYQSYLSGIKTAHHFPHQQKRGTINRTLVELKLREAHERLAKQQAINRTLVELKRLFRLI